jgi:predicted nucleic acid-binding protein
MGQYLIDNNVISSYFSEAFSEKAMDFLTEVIDLIPNISVITEIEALSWVNKDTSKEKIIQEFIRDVNIIPLTPAVVNECVALRRRKKIKTPDAIIAATAIVHNLSLITSDKDFNHIKGLKVIDPHSMKS